ncbi:MAG TPA: M14 metallopeptidase family protein [Gemmatimonadaceae bacterium]|nr:M14 metallopeptidase family protein [Gemmatimonadaceae bacterium]
MPRPVRRILGAALLLAVPSVAAGQSVPTPESVFGFPVGRDSTLFGYDQSIAYFRRLAEVSNHVRLIEVGHTSFGKPWTAVLISSPANLARLDRYREINQRLARPETLTDDEARALAREGRALVDISGGLHASEIAGSQHTPQLAYELVSKAGEPATREILDNTILFLWPSINPDGQDIVVNWCRDRLAGRNPPPMELYQKYIGHDNNRDSYMLNVVESRVIARTWREWEPQIIYVHHQSSPFPTRIWVPPFADPVGRHAPPILARTVNAIGMRIASELDQEGKRGAVHMLATFDAWYPGYIDYMPMYQNIAAWWTETQGGNCGVPRVTTVDSLPPDYRDLRPRALYESPWAEGRWGLRDQVDYMVTASIATLRYAAKFREELLYNRYQAGRNTITQYRTSAPYAYIVPQTQHDPLAPVELLRRMAFLGVHVRQLDTAAGHEGVTYPRGTWVIPMDQGFAQLARSLFEPQVYPDLGDDLPYDAAGWTLPYQMNVQVVEARAPLAPEFRAALGPVRGGEPERWGASPEYPLTTHATAAAIVPLPGSLTGRGNVVLLDPAQTNAFRFINRAIADGGTLRFVPAAPGQRARYAVAGSPAGSFQGWASALAVRGERVGRMPASSLAPTRIALYKGGPGNMDQGWTEWLLDTWGFAYTLIGPADLQAGNLGARFDVIVMASQNLLPGGGRGGRGGGGPPAVGGRGGGAGAAAAAANQDSARVRAVDEFVRGGGTLVAWNQGSTSLISALQLPVRNVVAGVARRDFFTGGSILRVVTDPVHPVMAGMPDTADVMVYNSPVFAPAEGFEGAVLAKYPPDRSPLRSGFLHGESYLRGNVAAVDVKRGAGHIVLFAFQPQWRGQPLGTFRTVFNSLFYARELSAEARGTPGFWTPATAPAR